MVRFLLTLLRSMLLPKVILILSGREITGILVEQRVDPRTAALLKNAMSNSVTSVHKVMRLVGKE